MAGRFQELGEQFLAENKVNDFQFEPAVASLTGGGFAIAWESLHRDAIMVQIFDADGDPVGAPIVVAKLERGNREPAITGLSTGGFIVTWADVVAGESRSELRAQIFDADGDKVGNVFLAASSFVSANSIPSISALPDGGFIIVRDISNEYSVRGQIFGETGIPAGPEFLIAEADGSYDFHASVAVLASGAFVVAWQDGAPGEGEVRIRRFDAAGTPLGVETTIDGAAPNQDVPAVSALASGGFVVTWEEAGANGRDIKVQLFDTAGNRVGGPFLANSVTQGEQTAPAVSALPGGGFVIAWEDGSGTSLDRSGTAIKAQIFDGLGGKVGEEYLVNSQKRNSQFSPTISTLADGNVVIGWAGSSATFPAPAFAVQAQILAIAEIVALTGTNAGESLVGGAGPNDIFALDGNDVVSGAGGNDLLFGGGGNDEIAGGAGNDRIEGGAGDDQLSGDAGDDIVLGGDDNDSLSNAGGGDDLLDGGAGDDIIDLRDAANVESVLAYGGPGADLIRLDWGYAGFLFDGPTVLIDAGADDDRIELRGTAAKTVITLGSGRDTVFLDPYFGLFSSDRSIELTDFATGSGGDRLDLQQFLESNAYDWDRETNPFATGHLALVQQGADTLLRLKRWLNTDYSTLVIFRNTVASAFTTENLGGLPPDGSPIPGLLITGTSEDDRIVGGAGPDTIEGLGGRDTLSGGGGRDTLRGGEGADYLAGGAGNDLIQGGDQADHGFGEAGDDRIDGGADDDHLYGGLGKDYLDGGAGNDWLEGEDGDDILDLSGGGRDVAFAGPGNDEIRAGAALGLDDSIDGGEGEDDRLVVQGNYSAGHYLAHGTLSGIETFRMLDGHSYKFTTVAGSLDAGRILAVDASALEAANRLTFDGSAELDGAFRFVGGAGADVLIGGAQADRLDGGAGADILTGKGGNDVYIVDNVGDTVTELAAEGDADEIRTALADYTLPANVEILTATSAAGQTLRGNGGANRLNGADGADRFYLQQGGDDASSGGGGSDGFYFGAQLGAGDRIDGGTGADDQLVIQGNYDAVLADSTIAEIETLVFLSGADTRFGDPGGNLYDYRLVLADGNIAASGLLTINANALLAGEDLILDGSAERDGRFAFYAGLGNDRLTGGAQNDGFFFGNGGRFSAADRVDGGSGADDQLVLRGDYGSAQIVFAASTMTNIETLVVLSASDTRFAGGGAAFSYNLKTDDANVAAGARLVVNANSLSSAERLMFDGGAEADGFFRILSGKGDDTLAGGAGNDFLYGSLGADVLSGGGGADTYFYRFVSESTAASIDTIRFGAGDRIDLSSIDAVAGTPANDAFLWIGGSAFSGAAGELRVYESGGQWFVAGDTDGDRNADLLIAVESAAPLTTADFAF